MKEGIVVGTHMPNIMIQIPLTLLHPMIRDTPRNAIELRIYSP